MNDTDATVSIGYDGGNDSPLVRNRHETHCHVQHPSIAASSSGRPRRCRCRPRATRTSPAATTASASRSSAAAAARRRTSTSSTASRREGKPVAPVAVCDVWDGLEDEYDVDFGGKTTRRRYAQGLYPSARKCRLDPADKTRVTKDYRRVLDRKDVDAVCIATPDHWHGRMTVDALAAGKDVYVEKPMTRRAEEAVAVLDAWQRTGRVVTVGVQSMADPVWVRRSTSSAPAAIGHVAHAQTGRLPQRRSRAVALLPARRADDTRRRSTGTSSSATVRAGRPSRSGRRRSELPFDRAAFAQWRCLSTFSGGPFTDLLAHHVTRMIAAMGVRFPARVTAGGGLYLEYDGRDVPDVGDRGRGLRGGLSARRHRRDDHRLPDGRSDSRAARRDQVREGRLPRLSATTRPAARRSRRDSNSRPRRPRRSRSSRRRTRPRRCGRTSSIACGSRRQSTFCPPDLGAAAVARDRDGRAELPDRASGAVLGPRPPRGRDRGFGWAERWEQRSRARGKPNQVFGWTGGDTGSTLQPPGTRSSPGRG